MSDVGDRNKDVIRRLFHAVDQGDLEAAAGYYAPDYVDHTPSQLRQQAGGREGLRRTFEVVQRAFPDTRHTIEDLLAEADKVVARVTAKATHTGELFGHPPTGKVVTLSGITIFRLVDGRIVERWAQHGVGLLEQLGLAPRHAH